MDVNRRGEPNVHEVAAFVEALERGRKESAHDYVYKSSHVYER
ncbi:MAG: hypothetical protein ACMXYM_00275 [Candidatus Woesearchaeota archaeon]